MSLQGPIPVEFGTVFPSGAYAAGAFDPVRNFDASTGEKFVQSTDKATGAPLWVIEVIDPDPAARTRAVKVKVAAAAGPPQNQGRWRREERRRVVRAHRPARGRRLVDVPEHLRRPQPDPGR